MKKIFILSLIFLMVPLYVFADEIYLKRGDDRAPGFAISGDEIFSRMAPRLVIDCQFAKLEANVVATEIGDFTLLTIPRFHSTNEIGSPKLPMMLKLIELPFGVKPVVRVLSCTEQEYNLKDLGITHPLMPCQPSYQKDFTRLPLVYDEGAYKKDAYLHQTLLTLAEIGVMRNLNLYRIEVAPLAYNPVQGKIKVYNDIQMEISLEGSDLALTAEMQKKYFSPYFAWASDQILTPSSLSTLRADPPKYPVTYVIVSDRMFANDLRPLVDWKTAKGFNVVVAYTDTIGATKEQIQKFVHDLYKNATPEKPAPTFLLLVGDQAQIPAFSGTAGSYITDLYYGAVTADKIPDIYYGRFSAANSGQLVPQIEKTLLHEKCQFLDTAFLKSVVLVAGWDSSHAVEWGWPQVNYAAKYYYNKESGFDNVSLFLTSGSQQNVAKIVSAVNSGAIFVNYTAHGSQTDWSDPSFTKANIDSLTNKGRYPLVVGNCCLTNSFQIDTCFGEAWLRAKDKGAIGYIGGSSYTYWDEDLWWGNGYYPIAHPNSQGLPPKKESTGIGAYDIAMTKEFASNAVVMVAGNLAVEESPSSRKVYYWEVYHLMGDPSVTMCWGLPGKLTVNHPKQIKVGTTEMAVKTKAEAYVGVTANGALVGAGMVDGNGDAKVTLKAFEKAAELVLVVTKKNSEPYQATIEVVK
jgi:hypothetical protein